LGHKFQSLYNASVPTGDPECPPHIQKAKRLHYCVEECADLLNLGEDVAKADPGINDANDDNDDKAADGVEGCTRNGARVLFAGGEQRVLRPLVRTPHSAVSSQSGNGLLDATQVWMASLPARMEHHEDVEHEDR
jgi:hypothetical protein